MSAFDDEFGLFGEDEAEEDERRSTLGARKIATSETVINDIEPEDDAAPPRRRNVEGSARSATSSPARFERRPLARRPPVNPEVSQTRAVELLAFLAKKLVSKPDAVSVEVFSGDRGPVLELAVDPEDLGKVIGRAGRVAQALRTVVRAGAESKVAIDILDVDEVYEDEDGDPVAQETLNDES